MQDAPQEENRAHWAKRSALEAVGAWWGDSEACVPVSNLRSWAIRFRVTIINPIPVRPEDGVPGSEVGVNDLNVSAPNRLVRRVNSEWVDWVDFVLRPNQDLDESRYGH
jgi:hypothetical protein